MEKQKALSPARDAPEASHHRSKQQKSGTVVGDKKAELLWRSDVTSREQKFVEQKAS